MRYEDEIYHCSHSLSTEEFPFDVIVVTSPNERAAKAALSGPLKSLSALITSQGKDAVEDNRDVSSNSDEKNGVAITNEVLILSTYDPFNTKMGSGGGTIAALAYADNVWKERQKQKEMFDATSSEPSILIIHAGGDSSRCPTQMALGKAWTSLPVSSHFSGSFCSSESTIMNPTSMLVTTLSKIFSKLPRGSIIVAASDVLLSIPFDSQCDFQSEFSNNNINSGNMVLGLAVPAPLHVATNHGVFTINNEHRKNNENNALSNIAPVLKFLQKPTISEMKKEAYCCISSSADSNNSSYNEAYIDTGVVTFLPFAAKTMRVLASTPDAPMFRCTYHGLEHLHRIKCNSNTEGCDESLDIFAKRQALKIELYSHLMLALSTHRSENELSNFAGTTYAKDKYLEQNLEKKTPESVPNPQMPTRKILSSLYDIISKLTFHVLVVNQGQFCHLGTTRELLDLLTIGNCCNLSNTNLDGKVIMKEEILADDTNKELDKTQSRCEQFGRQCQLVGRASSFVGPNVHTERSSVVLNSVLTVNENYEYGKNRKNPFQIGSMSVLEHCDLRCADMNCLSIGNNCLVSGIRGTFSKSFSIPDGICLQVLPLLNELTDLDKYVCIMLHVDDDIKKSHSVLGLKISRFLEISGLQIENIWPKAIDQSARKIWNGDLHPILQIPTNKNNLGSNNISENESKSIDLSLIFLWISETILRPDMKCAEDLSPDAKISLNTWKKLKRFSLQSIRSSCDALHEFQYRQTLPEKMTIKRDEAIEKVCTILRKRQNSPCFIHPFIDSYLGGDSFDINELWKEVDGVIHEALYAGNYDIVSRCFMIVSLALIDIYGAILNAIHSYDSTNKNTPRKRAKFSLDFDKNLLRSSKRADATHNLLQLRNSVFSQSMKWGPSGSFAEKTSQNIKNCAILFEEAAAIFTEACIGSLNMNGTMVFKSMHSSEKWSIASAPARVDLSGGWSDTPPISFIGGSVVNAAVKVDNLRPLLARSRKVYGKSGGIHLVTEMRSPIDGRLVSSNEVNIQYVKDLLDFRNPKSVAALLKAALVCLGLLPNEFLNNLHLSSTEIDEIPIQPYLNKFLGIESKERVALEVISTSLLPQGSGMGGSSILGGCVLASIGVLIGYDVIIQDDESQEKIQTTNAGSATNKSRNFKLTPAVLVLEQLMTTGGGWQDQIGGLVGGFKIARSVPNKLPLQVEINKIPVSVEVRREFNERFVLIFTGKPRLAKNLLQNVLRSWARRTSNIVATVDNLISDAEKLAQLLKEGNIDEVGEYVTNYWELKKTMVGPKGGAEPEDVHSLLSFLFNKKYIVGATLCGAGGGGFLLLITRKGLLGKELKKIVGKANSNVLKSIDTDNFSWHDCDLCEEGLRLDAKKDGVDFELDWLK